MDDMMKVLIEEQAGHCPYMCTMDVRGFVNKGENVTFETFQAYVTDVLEFHKADVEDREFDCTIPGTPEDVEKLKWWRSEAETHMRQEFAKFVALCDVMQSDRLDEDIIDALDIECLFTLGRFCCYRALFQACEVTTN